MRRPLLLGVVVLLTAHALWVAGAIFGIRGVFFGALIWAAIPVAAFVAALAASKHKVWAGVLLALPASLLFALSNAVAQWLELSVIYSGVGGAVLVACLSLPVAALLAAIGAGLAHLSPFQPV
jgi:hypothetical protein